VVSFYQREYRWGYGVLRLNCGGCGESDSAACGEEGLEKGTGFCCENAGGDFNLVIQSGAGEKFEAGAEGAPFWIVGSVDESGDACLDDCAGAHCAWLERYIKNCFREAIIRKLLCGFAKHDNFGVRGGVAVANGAVAAAGENLIPMDEHGADGDFAGLGGGAGFFQRDLHEFLITHCLVTENITLLTTFNCGQFLADPYVARILDIRLLAKETVNMKELLGRLFQLDVLKGMSVTFRTQHPGNVYTEQYPHFEMAYCSGEGAIWDSHRLEEGPTPTRYTR